LNQITTGVQDLDEMLEGGLHKDDLLVLCGSPAMSLIDLALTITAHVGIDSGKNAIIYSRSKVDTAERLLAVDAGVLASRSDLDLLDESDYGRIKESAGRLANASIFVDELGADLKDAEKTPAGDDADLVVLICDPENPATEWAEALLTNAIAPAVVVAEPGSPDLLTRANIVVEAMGQEQEGTQVEFRIRKSVDGKLGKPFSLWLE
jgi:hypothetical protein